MTATDTCRNWDAKQAKAKEAEKAARNAVVENALAVEQSRKAYDARTAVEQEAMISLMRLAGTPTDPDLKPPQLKELITTLLVRAQYLVAPHKSNNA